MAFVVVRVSVKTFMYLEFGGGGGLPERTSALLIALELILELVTV